MDVLSDYTESSTITFEWTLKGIKNLFDSTKGEKKSKVTKSIRFSNNRWQILFYANAGQTKEGTENGGFVSLYLSCEPTPEEREAALASSGRWVREGVYKFSFELRNVGKGGTLYNSKEAHNHSFSWKTANWGWAQFARRDSVYYQSMAVKSNDAFVIICTITSSPRTPPVYTIPRQPVPRTLLETVGALLDDPLYSDVKFIIPKRGQSISNGWTIWASKKLLQRAEYFQTMFSSNFAEGSNTTNDANQTPRTTNRDIRSCPPQLNLLLDEFEDSDNEFDDDLTPLQAFQTNDDPVDATNGTEESPGLLLSMESQTMDWDRVESDGTQSAEAHTSSPQLRLIPLTSDIQTAGPVNNTSKMSIVVKDAAYTTYKAMLYYIYTDNIVFAPLSSSFIGVTSDGTTVTPSESIPSTPSEGSQIPDSKRFSHQEAMPSRADWIREWLRINPDRPAPCSAKSIYRIADRLDLTELKERAAEHITKSLTVENIAYEVFSPFAAAFEALRKVEIDFFLAHWQDIRASDTMKHVWMQIRNGRHPGFEEVWPVIIQSLEFKPASSATPNQSPKNTGSEPML
ncbi:hypothetical protein HYPSUDRAFT_65842 [Hypholoma sublateritium FD-334 SS-4]|uniref:MATH domain-containing protein n=1 Tax=Hypholoma sublateritium (strain FD-334 SS-4) TaxID=945553 RepID=A0A0D2P5N6_HYPSF|nr:hypothetical protein HYPSUDRAFT_65842 [Hypholoma sublateritium FD-334 SS-4]